MLFPEVIEFFRIKQRNQFTDSWKFQSSKSGERRNQSRADMHYIGPVLGCPYNYSSLPGISQSCEMFDQSIMTAERRTQQGPCVYRKGDNGVFGSIVKYESNFLTSLRQWREKR